MALLTTLRRVRELRRIATMSRAELEADKLAKFRRLARHAAQHSPYYARIARERGINMTTCVPADFPVLTKATLMANFDAIVTDRRVRKSVVADFLERSVDPRGLLPGGYHPLHTSGSSGEIGYFLFSEQEWICGMSQGMLLREAQRPPSRRLGRQRIAYYGAVGGHFAGVSMMTSTLRGFGRLFMSLELFEINSPLPAVLDRLNAHQPDVLVGYTAGLKILADQQQAGRLRIAPRSLRTAGEAMPPADKALLESAFGCPAFNDYGSTEHLLMGVSDPSGHTMTLCDSDLIYECFDDHSLVTNLFNYTQPLIRYRMSDVLRPVASGSTASPYLVINSLVGRTERIPDFVNRNGDVDFIHPITVVELFIPGVTRFQMRLVDRTFFRFAVVCDPALDQAEHGQALDATRARLRSLLDQKLMQNVSFEVVSVEDIPIDPQSGKFRLIVDDAHVPATIR